MKVSVLMRSSTFGADVDCPDSRSEASSPTQLRSVSVLHLCKSYMLLWSWAHESVGMYAKQHLSLHR